MQTLYMNIATFLPLYISQKHPSINSAKTGVILCMFQLAALLTSNSIGALLHKIGRKPAIIIGGVVNIFTSIAFGLLAYVEDDSLFLGLAIANRFISGVADAFVNVAAYSIATIEFTENRDTVLGYCQSGTGLGLMMGPVLGAIIYAQL